MKNDYIVTLTKCLSSTPIHFLSIYVLTFDTDFMFQFIYRLGGAYSVGILLYHNFNNFAVNDSHVLVWINIISW